EKSFGEGAGQVLDAYTEAVETGDVSGVSMLAARGLAESELHRRALSNRIAADGPIVGEAVIGAGGEQIGVRLKAHPGIEPMIGLSQQLGHTATEMRITPKSRGEGAKDEAITKALHRDAILRGLDKNLMPPPALPPAED